MSGRRALLWETHKLVLATGDVGDVHVVGGGGEIFELLAGEDVDGDHVDLGVTVLASLGGGHVDNLARAALDDDVTVLPQGRALHGEGGGSASIGGVEGVLVLLSRKLAQPVLAPAVRHGSAPAFHGPQGMLGVAKDAIERTCASSAILKMWVVVEVVVGEIC